MGCNLAHPAHLHLMLALALTEPTRHSSRQLPVSSPSSAPSAASMAHPWRWCAQQPASPPRRITPAPSALLHGAPPQLHLLSSMAHHRCRHCRNSSSPSRSTPGRTTSCPIRRRWAPIRRRGGWRRPSRGRILPEKGAPLLRPLPSPRRIAPALSAPLHGAPSGGRPPADTTWRRKSSLGPPKSS